MKVTTNDYTVNFKHYGEVTVPKGTRTNHMTASGIDENYNFVCEFKWIDENYPDYANTLKMDVGSYGINIPANLVEEVKSC